MRDNGLILPNRAVRWFTKYSSVFGSETNAHRFLSFMQIARGEKFDKLVEGLKYFDDMRKYLYR